MTTDESKAVKTGEPAAPRLLDEVSALKYVTVELASTYRAIVQVFFEAKQRYVIELRPRDVGEALERGNFVVEIEREEQLDQRLDQLVTWGNLTRGHDTATVTSINDFYRRRHVYYLSAVGEAAHRAVLRVEATIGKSGSLQTLMLVEIRDALSKLVALAGESEPDAAKLVRSFHALFTAFEKLTEEASRFMGELGRHDSSARMDEDRFGFYKKAVLEYVGRFVAELRRLAGEIAADIAALQERGMAALLHLAVSKAELPPTLDGVDPAERWVGEQEERWQGVAQWFTAVDAGIDDAEPTVERLAAVARTSVVALTRTLGRLNERRVRSVDRAADFRTLARWFAACPDDRAAHVLWEQAFGLYPSRHYHLAEEDVELTAASASWWDADPVEVPVRLRTRGKLYHAGRPSPAADFADQKRFVAMRRSRERREEAAALRRFLGRGPLAFSELGSLESNELQRLLALIDEALATPPRRGVRSARSADGRFLITLAPPSPGAHLAEIETPEGRIRCRDYVLTVAEATSTEPAAPPRDLDRTAGGER